MKKNQSAFTLIELLVVITIIAILASIALPVFNGVTERANQTKDLSNAKQVGLALKLFAGDNNGNFPRNVDPDDSASAAITTANQAYRELIPNYLTSETIFFVSGSAFTPNEPNNTIDQTPSGGNYTQTLQPGENTYAYVTNLTETSNAAFPLLADGMNNTTTWQYSTDKTAQGGVWGGKKAIVVFCDTSGQILKLDPTALTPQRTFAGGTKASIFSTSDPATWLGAGNLTVNPE